MQAYFDDFFKYTDPEERIDQGAFGCILIKAFDRCAPLWRSVKTLKKTYPFSIIAQFNRKRHAPHISMTTTFHAPPTPPPPSEFEIARQEAAKMEESLTHFIFDLIHCLNAVNHLINSADDKEKKEQEFEWAKASV